MSTKWQRLSPTKRFGAVFAVLGFVIAVAILSISWYINTHGLRYDLSMIALVLCLPSLTLMATDNASPIVQVFAMLLVTVENAVLFGLVGLGLGTLLSRSGR